MDTMLQSRRAFLLRAAFLAGAALTGWAVPTPVSAAAALQNARRFLLARQAADGAWRSTRYGAFREGDALTPLVLWALGSMDGMGAACAERGLQWLEELTAAQAARAEPWSGLAYPLFTAGYAAQVLRAEATVGARRFGLI